MNATTSSQGFSNGLLNSPSQEAKRLAGHTHSEVVFFFATANKISAAATVESLGTTVWSCWTVTQSEPSWFTGLHLHYYSPWMPTSRNQKPPKGTRFSMKPPQVISCTGSICLRWSMFQILILLIVVFLDTPVAALYWSAAMWDFHIETGGVKTPPSVISQWKREVHESSCKKPLKPALTHIIIETPSSDFCC